MRDVVPAAGLRPVVRIRWWSAAPAWCRSPSARCPRGRPDSSGMPSSTQPITARLRSSRRWCLADDRIQGTAIAGFRAVVASHTDHTVAVGQPFLSAGRVTCHRKAFGKAHFRCIDIAIGQCAPCQFRIDRADEFRRHRAAGLAQRTHFGSVAAVVAGRVVPLGHEIVLHPHDRQPVEIVLTY